MTARGRVRVRALWGSTEAGRETEACLPVSSTGVETDRAAAAEAEATRRTRTAGTKRRR